MHAEVPCLYLIGISVPFSATVFIFLNDLLVIYTYLFLLMLMWLFTACAQQRQLLHPGSLSLQNILCSIYILSNLDLFSASRGTLRPLVFLSFIPSFEKTRRIMLVQNSLAISDSLCTVSITSKDGWHSSVPSDAFAKGSASSLPTATSCGVKIGAAVEVMLVPASLK